MSHYKEKKELDHIYSNIIGGINSPLQATKSSLFCKNSHKKIFRCDFQSPVDFPLPLY